MKKCISRLLFLSALSLAGSYSATAADLVVGPGRTYTTIADAVAAAADGDRILVQNRTAIYAETPIITKSLTIMSAQEGVYIRCSGTWTFSPATAGKTLTVMSMNFLSGDITTTANAPAGTRSAVRVLGCILNGNISLASSNFDVTVAADSINGKVSLRFGKVMGNYIGGVGGAVEVTTDATASTDSVWVVGNRIFQSSGFPAITLNTSSNYIHCTNNLLYIGNYGSTYQSNNVLGITMATSQTTGAGRNSIVNNTLYNNSQYGYFNFNYVSYGISLSNPGLNTTVSNNLFLGNASSGYNGPAIVQSGGSLFLPMAYNLARTYYTFGGAAANNLGNATTSNTSLTSEGMLVAGSDAINGGTPDDEFLDLDLTRNDVGAYGGSLSLANFPRFGNTANVNANLGGRTYFFQAPRAVLQGQSVKVKAVGFDR